MSQMRFVMKSLIAMALFEPKNRKVIVYMPKQVSVQFIFQEAVFEAYKV